MMKTNTSRVYPALVDLAIERVDDIHSVYSQCIKLWFAQKRTLDVGFNNKEMVTWIFENRPGIFDEKGKKVQL